MSISMSTSAARLHAAIAFLAPVLAVGCAHREPERDGRDRGPVGDIAATLEPCPAAFVTKSVREVLARRWPHGACFGVRGRLTATYGLPSRLRYGNAKAAPDPAAGVVALDWVLTDLADPFTPRRDDRDFVEQPTIHLLTAGNYQPWLLPLQRCNQTKDGRPIMPAETRLELPRYRMADVERLNAGFAGLTVGVFGGQNARDFEPNRVDSFAAMVITHVCRMDLPPIQDGAPANGGPQDDDDDD